MSNPISSGPVLSLFTAALMTIPGAPSAGAAQASGANQTETDRLNAWFAEKWEEQLDFRPVQRTMLGMPSSEIGDLSLAGDERFLAWQRESVVEMRESFDYELLTPEGADFLGCLRQSVVAGRGGE